MQLDHFCSHWSIKLPMKFFAPIMRYCLMSFFDRPFFRSMISGGEFHLNVKGPHYVLIKIRYKTIAVVGNRRFWHTKPRHMLHEGFTTVHGRRRRHRERLEPPGGPAEGGQQVLHALRLWQRSYHIQMYGRKPLIRNRKVADTGLYCSGLLCNLAWMT